MLNKINLSITAATVAFLLGIAATALAADSGPSIVDGKDVPVLASTGLERAIEAKQLRHRYDRTLDRAKEFGIEPKTKLNNNADVDQLEKGIENLENRIDAAKKELAREQAAFERQRDATVAGLEGTLASIAACESGGNPAAIGGGGLYRGKYQFDMQTWAGVGGSGDPAAASEAEQDYRAALLYQRAGSSPWPVCGS